MLSLCWFLFGHRFFHPAFFLWVLCCLLGVGFCCDSLAHDMYFDTYVRWSHLFIYFWGIRFVSVTAAAGTLDSVADKSRKKVADGVARSPSRLCSIDGKICCYGDALSTIFLLLRLASYFSFFAFLFILSFFVRPGMLISFVSLRLCSRHLLLSASTYSERVFDSTMCTFCLCHLYPTPSWNSFVFVVV